MQKGFTETSSLDEKLFTTFEEENGWCNTRCDILCMDFSRLQLNKCNLLYIFVFFIRFEPK